MTLRATAAVATATALLLLAACEGDEQREIGPALDLEKVRDLIGASAPAEAPVRRPRAHPASSLAPTR